MNSLVQLQTILADFLVFLIQFFESKRGTRICWPVLLLQVIEDPLKLSLLLCFHGDEDLGRAAGLAERRALVQRLAVVLDQHVLVIAAGKHAHAHTHSKCRNANEFLNKPAVVKYTRADRKKSRWKKEQSYHHVCQQTDGRRTNQRPERTSVKAGIKATLPPCFFLYRFYIHKLVCLSCVHVLDLEHLV